MQLILGIEGHTLSHADLQRLSHASVAGVILFRRNYEAPEQLKALTGTIRQKFRQGRRITGPDPLHPMLKLIGIVS